MTLIRENFKKFKSKFDKVKFLFAILSLLQFVIITLFQARLSIRNYTLNHQLSFINLYCRGIKPTFELDYYAIENYLFIAYQAFLMYLGLSAIFGLHVMQICIYSLMNFAGYIYLIVQMAEIRNTIAYERRECLNPEVTEGNNVLESYRLDPSSIDPELMSYELPQFIVYTLFLMITGYLSLTLYLQFGFNHYFQKKVGNNELFVSLLRRRFKLKFLLKSFVFFSIVYSIFCIFFLLRYFTLYDYPKALTCLIFLCFFVFALRLTRVTFISVDNEYNHGMFYFTYLWILVMLNNIIFCLIGLYFMNEGWYFLFPYNLVYFGVALASYYYALKVKRDFGKGLKEAIASNKIELELELEQL